MVDKDTFLTAIFRDLDPEMEWVGVGRGTRNKGCCPKPWMPIANALLVYDMVGIRLELESLALRRAGDADYFCCTSLSLESYDTEADWLHARTSGARRVFAVVFDDIGEMKEKLGKSIGIPDLEPTWKLETKPGSQQWGYRFEQPVSDGWKECSVVMASAIAAGFCDPGVTAANGVRLVRLPGSQPPGKAHAARLVHWAPDRAWANPAALLDALGWPRVTAPAVMAENALHTDASDATILTGSPAGDPLFAWLREQGYLNGQRSGDTAWRWKCIHCEEHRVDESGYADDFEGGRYFPAEGGGTFKCWRGGEHLKERAKPFGSVTRYVRYLLTKEGAPAMVAPPLGVPSIKVGEKLAYDPLTSQGTE